MPQQAFYGWRIVASCLTFATVSWSLGTFGMGVYIYALTETRGFSTSTVSTAVTLAYITSALLMVSVGRFISRRGPHIVIAGGVLALATAVAVMPYCEHVWQVYAAFLTLGLGIACLSTNSIGSTLAPWFDRLQGRAISTAMLGASIGGMIGTPLLMAGIAAWGFQTTAIAAAVAAVLIVLPLVIFVLKKRPEEVGQLPDGTPPPSQHQEASAAAPVTWTLSQAVKTRQFRSHVAAFSLGQMVQVGFLSHHVPIAVPTLGAQGAAAAVFSAAVAAFVGRLALARYADQVDIRKVGAGIFLFAAASLIGMAVLPGAWALMAMSICFGLTVGNITTLSPMVIRREFGAASFGVVFGMAATLVQISMAMGPTVYGVLRDLSGSYELALVLGAIANTAAAIALAKGRQAEPASAMR
ncbi:MFS transporter [Achromobacter sp. F4_2707]|uniref:MFS transporter n=1 Tax=Achromobacter sp. F4_2707 TaxID=3114286 RepID=UPI0039C6CE8F